MKSRRSAPDGARHARRAFVLLGVLTASVLAQRPGPSSAESGVGSTPDGVAPEAMQAAADFRKLAIEPRDTYDRVKQVVRGLDWSETLRGGLGAATQSGRPLLLVQALGDIDGFT